MDEDKKEGYFSLGLISGEELLSKATVDEQGVVWLDKPCRVIPSAGGRINLIPFSFLIDNMVISLRNCLFFVRLAEDHPAVYEYKKEYHGGIHEATPQETNIVLAS